MNEINYTITSNDHTDYSTIRTNLIAPHALTTEFAVGGLTTLSSFTILDRNDYMIIQFRSQTTGKWTSKMQFNPPERYTSMNIDHLLKIFAGLFKFKIIIEFVKWSGNRFLIRTIDKEDPFEFRILDMSYRMKMITGFYDETMPIQCSTLYKITGGVRDDIGIGDDDFIEINGRRYFVFEASSLGLNDVITLSMMRAIVPDMEFMIESNGSLSMIDHDRELEITDISERMSAGTGFKKQQKSFHLYYILSKSAGYMQLTPVLYLTSNIGTTVYSYVGKDMVNQKILMRINNHFIPGSPIICNNFEFSSIIPSHALSDVWFKLVDANFKPVKLLSPMFLSATAKGINERFVDRPIFVEEEDQ
jgi:hypothetical protein